MPTLVIHAPPWRARRDGAKDFDMTLESRIGSGYALSKGQRKSLEPGCRVVLLCKTTGRRAEGRLVSLKPTEKTENGLQRYDVRFSSMQEVGYKSERLGRTGVTVY